MGVMLETPSGTFKTLMVDNVGRLEDIIATWCRSCLQPGRAGFQHHPGVRSGLADGAGRFITVPLSLVFAVCMMRGYKEKMAVYLRSGNEMNAALVEYVGGIQVIKAFGQGSKSFGEFSRSVNFFHDSTLAWWRQSWFWMAGFKRCSPPLYWARCPWERGSICRARWSCPCSWPASSSPSALWPGSSNSALPGAAFLHGSQPGPHSGLPRHAGAAPAEKPVKLGERSFRFDRVCFSYDGKKEVLHDVNFTARTGRSPPLWGPPAPENPPLPS